MSEFKKAYFAGGCFWCLAQPFDEARIKEQGIIKVITGYMGGVTKNPTYKEVKSGKTGHLESICITYDTSKITYQQLLEMYFDNIDPFDEEGQYIDRGSNYKCAIFYLDDIEKNEAKEKIDRLEKNTGKTIKVELRSIVPFYEAEEEHQDYYAKNDKEYKEELLVSGRLRKKGEFTLGGKNYKVVKNKDGTYDIQEKD